MKLWGAHHVSVMRDGCVNLLGRRGILFLYVYSDGAK